MIAATSAITVQIRASPPEDGIFESISTVIASFVWNQHKNSPEVQHQGQCECLARVTRVRLKKYAVLSICKSCYHMHAAHIAAIMKTVS